MCVRAQPRGSAAVPRCGRPRLRGVAAGPVSPRGLGHRLPRAAQGHRLTRQGTTTGDSRLH